MATNCPVLTHYMNVCYIVGHEGRKGLESVDSVDSSIQTAPLVKETPLRNTCLGMNKNLVLCPTVPEIKNDCADEDQRQFPLPNRTREDSFVPIFHVCCVSSDSVFMWIF
jgi:hypothetical protein